MDQPYSINKDRLVSLFLSLAGVDAESFNERKMADRLKNELCALGFEVSEDGTSSATGSNAGNIYAYLKGDLPGGPVLLSGHMDTVKPGNKKRAILHEDGTITSAGDTVLGADDLNAAVSVLEAVRSVKEAKIPRRDIEIVFSVCEEPYCKGIKAFDFKKIRAKSAYIFDLSGAPGKAAFAAPSIISFEACITGRSAHAGFEPEKGINAIDIMSRAISKIRQGRLDEETTFNIGYISGGLLTNIVPEKCICKGEIRSLSHKKALREAEHARDVFKEEAKKENTAYDFKTEVNIQAYETPLDSPCAEHFTSACGRLGLSGEMVKTSGGSDNNIFAAHGIEGIVLSCGMYRVHSVNEYTSIDDLVSCASLAAELITS